MLRRWRYRISSQDIHFINQKHKITHELGERGEGGRGGLWRGKTLGEALVISMTFLKTWFINYINKKGKQSSVKTIAKSWVLFSWPKNNNLKTNTKNLTNRILKRREKWNDKMTSRQFDRWKQVRHPPPPPLPPSEEFLPMPREGLNFTFLSQ